VVLAALRCALRGSGVMWAWQGDAGAVDAWLAGTGPADLDLWCGGSAQQVAALAAGIDRWPAARVADAADPRRLRHTSWAVETGCGLAVIDLTVGDLRVGPVLLVPSAAVGTVPDGTGGYRLSGVAGAADGLLRPLLRGRVPAAARLAEARACWDGAAPTDREVFLARLAAQLGPGLAQAAAAVLAGGTVPPVLAGQARRALAAASLRPANLAATWAQRWSVLPAGRSAGPLRLRTRGVLVVLVGTDGSGKSTVADGLAARLAGCGFPVRQAYFGMARGNLPGVALARRLLAGPLPGRAGTGMAGQPAAPAPLDRPLLRRAAAWFYAAEYGWRYATEVLPHRRRRRVVVCDRWVYDLHESPWPGSPAARVVQRLLPAPDVLVLPDAPAEVIHRRKPERPVAEQARQQARYRQLLAAAGCRVATLVADTSGRDPDPVGPVLAAVVRAAHRVAPADAARG
jgi:thymidylate kinase